MTTEQKEAVALVKDFTKMDFNNPMGWTGYYDTELKELQQAIETVLNLIQEQEKEIEKYKKLYQKALDDAVVTAHDNMQKDKIIELMADFIEKVTVDLKVAFGENMLWNRNEIKQYFERKVEDERNIKYYRRRKEINRINE